MTAVRQTLTLPVSGMTCGHCVATVRGALEGVPGVEEARVDLESGRAEVAFAPGAEPDPERLRAAVEAVGYAAPQAPGAPPAPAAPPTGLVGIGLPPTPAPAPDEPPDATPEDWDLAITGMHCASCVARVESALATVPGVEEARVNLATERARVRVDPAVVREEQLAEAVARAGYAARRAEADPSAGAESLRRERAEHVAYWRRRLLVGVALTVPLAILGLGPMLLPHVFGHAPWTGWAMFALATPLQVYLGAPFYRGAWLRLKQGSTNMDTLIALGSTTAYAYSLFNLLSGGSHGPTPHSLMDGASSSVAAAVITALVVACSVRFVDPS